jgi:hypothetical protein
MLGSTTEDCGSKDWRKIERPLKLRQAMVIYISYRYVTGMVYLIHANTPPFFSRTDSPVCASERFSESRPLVVKYLVGS